MTIWNLSQGGSIPGVPSDNHPSAGVAVEVNDANEVVSVTPLPSADFVADHVEEKAAPTDTDAPVKTDKVSDKAQP